MNALKKYVYKRRLSGDKAKVYRNLALRSWDEIKTIGFLYTVQDETEYIKFTSLVANLQSQKKEVRALGLLKSRDIPHYCYPRLAFDYFSKRDVSWYGKPGGNKVDDFLKVEFDLLVNLELCDIPYFNYIVTLSNAHLKAGMYSEKCSNIYDIMIHDKEVKDYIALFEHIKDYINVLRPSVKKPKESLHRGKIRQK
jgi:hypothetical protein